PPRPQRPGAVRFVLKPETLAHLPATTQTPEGSLTVVSTAEQEYVPPAQPASGRYQMKGPPIDFRLFQRPLPPKEKIPQRALVVSWESPAAGLFDRTLDVDATLTGVDGKPYPLLSARLERFPARGAEVAGGEARVNARYWFRVPPKGVVRGLTFSFALR